MPKAAAELERSGPLDNARGRPAEGASADQSVANVDNLWKTGGKVRRMWIKCGKIAKNWWKTCGFLVEKAGKCGKVIHKMWKTCGKVR